MIDVAKIFGKRLQQIRKMRGLTQAMFAELVGLEVSTISRIEKGSQYPKPENVNKFVEVLNVELKEFFTFTFVEKSREELIQSIYSILEKSTYKDLQFYNRVMQSHLEYKSHYKGRNL